MSPPPAYAAVTTLSPIDEKAPSRFAWPSPPPPIQLPLTSSDATFEQAQQQQKAHSRRRFIKTLFLIFTASFAFAFFSGLRFPGCHSRFPIDHGLVQEKLDSMADTFSLKRITSHLRIHQTSGSIQGEYTLKPGVSRADVAGEGSLFAPSGYSTSADISSQSGSVDVGIRVVEGDDDDFKGDATLLNVGSQSGSVKVRLHSRPSSSPVRANFRSTSGSIHIMLPSEFSGPFRIETRSGSFSAHGSFRDRLVIESDIGGLRKGWIYAEDDLGRNARGAVAKDREESLTISAQSGSVQLGDAF